jgi:predicted transcriptional regulator
MAEKASESELTVLAVLLEKGHATAAELHEYLSKDRGWAHSTVVTFLRRLEAKGLVSHSRPRAQRAFVYRPTNQARSTRHRVVRDLLERVFGGNPLPLVSSLLEDGNLREDQIRELHNMIEGHLRGEEKKS